MTSNRDPDGGVPVANGTDLELDSLYALLAEGAEVIDDAGALSEYAPTTGRVVVTSNDEVYVGDGSAWNRPNNSGDIPGVGSNSVADGTIKLGANATATIYTGESRQPHFVGVGSGGGQNDGAAQIQYVKTQGGNSGVELTEVAGGGVGLNYKVVII